MENAFRDLSAGLFALQPGSWRQMKTRSWVGGRGWAFNSWRPEPTGKSAIRQVGKLAVPLVGLPAIAGN